jgi:serine/threonine-protein kinase HipA
MEWARRMGFDVPPTEVRPLGELIGVPYEGDASSQVFLIERYDRTSGGRRIHQEDFQQIVGRRPAKKYDDITYDALTRLALAIVGDDVYDEMIRRLAFMVASGNDDAHAKNWSLLYPDGIRARLTPLYDQVFTAQWPQFGKTLALKLDGTKFFGELDLGHFRELARRVKRSPEHTEALVTETIERAASGWTGLRDHACVTAAYRAAMKQHWQKVPLLRPLAGRI